MLSKSKRQLKILYPILHYPPVIGGLEQWAENIAKRQSENTEIYIVTGRVKGTKMFEKNNKVTVLRTSLFELKDLSHSSLAYILTATPYILWRSFLLIFTRKVSLIHCHGFISAIIGYVLSATTGRPFIGTEQSLGWGEGKSRWLRRIVYRKARLCIAASRAVQEEFRKLGVKNIEIIPNGVDLEKFTAKDRCVACGTSDVRHKEFVILSVGRLEKIKGHKYLIEAFTVIKKEIPNAKLILVGDGSERFNLEEQIEELAIKDSVQFIGEVSHNDLPHYYHKADVFVMPSLSEGFGIAVIEAMACGVPVIASRVGGLADIISDGENGLLIGEANMMYLSSAIIELKGDVDLRLRIIKEALKKIQGYSWDAISARNSNLYNNSYGF